MAAIGGPITSSLLKPLPITYEILQLLFELGSFDTDDLILNTLGGVIGYLPIKLFYIVFKKNGTIRSQAKGQ
ncbi:VanZ family protein [Peribacillus frigoritolerans]|uniref:VanZ family protein n=1 Tax=Peribacillus frigoritolerans TaxID=450367 RepID=UPI0025A1D393|nr:VanZ family protein [Peribacillus frigoritolerans]MDM5308598.1 VanZ family protein [Peribacillus frigoritolerans]